MAKAGLSDKVEIKLQDYRDETGKYDRIASIEMFEAVGEKYWPVFFGKVKDCLKAGGTAGMQIITINEQAFPIYRKRPDFIQRYVFPGGMLPTPAILKSLGADHGLVAPARACLPAGLCPHAGRMARALLGVMGNHQSARIRRAL